MADRLQARRIIAQARLERYERRILAAVRAALDEMRGYADAQLHPPPMVVAALAVPPPQPFDPNRWRQAVARHLQPAAEDVFDDVAAAALAGLKWTDSGLAGVDMSARAARLVGLVEGLGPDVAAALAETLNHGVALGETIDQLAERVTETFDAGERQARLIARTEVHGGAEQATFDVMGAAVRAGVEVSRQWLATDDDRTRDTHAQADGQTVGANEPFQVGDALLMFPGDPDGPAEEVCNCRCTVVFVEPPDTDSAATAATADGEGGE